MIAGEAPPVAPRPGQQFFITGLGIGQIISWGTLYYSFPLIAESVGRDLGLSKPEVYGAATIGLLIASFTAYPIGVAIDRGYGRAVMTLGSALAGLLLLAWSQIESLWAFYPLLAGIGLAQAMTLYEPAFAVIARRYGAEARRGVMVLTLWGGFASTLFVPVIQFLLNHLDWRNTLIILGLINLGFCVTLHFIVIKTRGDAPTSRPSIPDDAVALSGRHAVRWALHQQAFWGLLIAFTVYYATFSGLTYHLYPLLIEKEFDTAMVVAAIALIGPAQVAGRIAIWVFAGRAPVRVIGKGVVLAFPIALLLLLLLPPAFASLAVYAIVYGAANGTLTIVRGIAVPEMLTPEAYDAINSVLAIPATIAKASAPLGVALLWIATGSYDTVLIAVLASSTLVVGGFWFAAAQTAPKQRLAVFHPKPEKLEGV
jgi:predicted MFS family arabinose efflux permease